MNHEELFLNVKNYIINELLYGDDSQLTENTSFYNSGIINSMGIIGIVTYIQNLGVDISDEEIVPNNFDTLASIKTYLSRKAH